uniref:Peptidase A2 domain-containing protein n=1 Tax=Scylla olivacea TaxID=85551 RepID=A0A0P4WDF7_SCYOL
MAQQLTAATGKRKRDDTSESTSLHLQVVPEARKLKRRRLGPYPTVALDSDGTVMATVNGHECRVLPDSGTTTSVLFLPLARRLGLVTGREEKHLMKFDTWHGLQTMEVVVLEDVAVLLEGGVEVHSPARVFPESFGEGYDMDLFVLDVNLLRRGRVVQRFHQGGSTLTFRRPRRLRTVPKQRPMKVFTFQVREEGGKEHFQVLLDTGCENFSISEEWKAKHRGGVAKVQDVYLNLRQGCDLHASGPSTLMSAAQDMVMGCRPLQQYEAGIDYGRQTVSFRFGAKTVKVKLQHV